MRSRLATPTLSAPPWLIVHSRSCNVYARGATIYADRADGLEGSLAGGSTAKFSVCQARESRQLTKMADRRAHWQSIYHRKAPEELTWFQAEPTISLELIERAGCEADDTILDVGAGSSRLVDGLLARGFRRVQVLDIAEAALAESKLRLGERAAQVEWIVGDLFEAELPTQLCLWHDRAVFHFLTEAAQRRAYVERLLASLRPGGHAVIASFAEDGPERCSGLPVVRYSPRELDDTLGPELEQVASRREAHRTPSGGEQRFIYGLFRRR